MPDSYAPWTDADLDGALAALGAELDGVPGADRYPDLSTAADRLTRALAAAPPAGPPAAPPAVVGRQPRRRYLRLAVSGTIAAAVAGALLLVPSTKDRTGAPAVPSQETVVALHNAAAVTIRQRDVPLRPGQFRYVDERAYVVPRGGGEHPLVWSYYLTTRTWVPYDEQQRWTRDYRATGPVHWLVGDPAAGRRQGVTDPLHYFGPADGRTTARCGDFMHVGAAQGPCVDATNGKQSTTYGLSRLPRDPRALLPLLNGDADGGPPGSAAIAINRASMLLRSGLVPADLRAAIYRALALMPELRITDRFANLDGRVGIAYGVADEPGQYREDIVIDPATGQYIGERTVLTRDDPSLHLSAGTVIDHTSLTTAVVNDAGAVPK